MKIRKIQMKKQILSILLCLIMLLSLAPMAAFAVTHDSDGKVTSIAFELGNYGYGKSTNQYWVSSERDGAMYIANIHESDSGIYTCEGSDPNNLEPTTDMYFAANKQYYFVLKFSAHWENVNGFSDSFTAENATLTVNGTQCEQVSSASDANGGYTAVFKLPVLDAVPMAIPFTKIVEQGGSVAPGAESFELEVKNLYERSNSPISNYTIDGLNFTTDGSGTSDKQFTISNDSFDAVLQLLDEGILVSEKQSGNEGWQYDGSVWCVKLHHAPVVNSLDDEAQTMSGYSFDFFKGEIADGEFVPDSQTPTDKMTFTNTYTKDNETVVTVKIPFVKKVTLGGDVAPTGETFKLEIFDIGNGNSDNYADVNYTAEVTVNGKGEFEGEIAITGPESQVEQFICEGFFVREITENAVNWTYSDAVWCVIPEWNEQQERVFIAYPTTKEASDNGYYYAVAEEPAEKMIFENIYTENKVVDSTTTTDSVTTDPITSEETDDKPQSPQTGDNNMMDLWIALLVVSFLGVAAIAVINKKKSVR